MRHIQRGIATSVILIIFLIAGVAITSSYLIFYQNQQKLKSINSFEDCAAAGYPIMESYPEQCNTPDGKHFVRELSEEEKKKLVPPIPRFSDETANWKTYINNNEKISFAYPADLFIRKDSTNDFIGFLQEPDLNSTQRFVVSIEENPGNLNIKEFKEKNKPIPDDTFNWIYEEILMGDIQGLLAKYELLCHGICDSVNQSSKQFMIIIKGNGKVVTFSSEKTFTEGEVSYLKGIIFTFKFLE